MLSIAVRRSVAHSHRLSVRQRLWFAHQIAQGLAYLASKGVVHRCVGSEQPQATDQRFFLFIIQG
jgi:serine/threonine protein kinase